ncbi:MAG: histidine kinase dimerization/phospho-acceptor domain-containing protein, partial [Gammaproteobacteria bacterium]
MYSWYRVLISGLLLAAFFLISQPPHTTYSSLYLTVSIGYIAISVLTLMVHHRHLDWQRNLSLISLISDIATIILLAHASGGLSSHLTILLVVCVAASTILLEGKLATFIAAFATLTLLIEQTFISLTTDSTTDNWIRAGTLGIVLFSTSLLAQKLASRLRESEALISAAEQDLLELQNLNHYIIQRMLTGVMVVDKTKTIQLMNKAASEQLDIEPMEIPSTAATPLHDQTLPQACPPLNDRLSQWLDNENAPLKPFRASPDCIEVSPHFARLSRNTGDQYIIFLDDTSRLTQQAQHLKLASLGQLTAAIAHEVRNPLGAISHAAQLLMESKNVDQADLKMTRIIQHHCLRVNDIIENVLQLSRRKTSLIQRFKLDQWVHQFVDEFTKAYNKPCHIDLSGLRPCWVQADPSQLNQVLTNLVENGIRYSLRQTGSATLTLLSGELPGSTLPYLEVNDDGPGIPDHALTRLFEPFYTSESKGTGL